MDAEFESQSESAPILPADAIEADVQTLSALANKIRYRLLRVLAAADGEVCVCELVDAVDAGQSAVSHALSTLHGAGLVSRRKEGRWRYYRTTEAAETLVDALDAARGGR